MRIKMQFMRAAIWDVVAVSLIPLAGFANFISSRGYDALRPEVLLACAVVAAIAVVIVAVIALRPDSLRPIIFALLVATFIYIENGFALPQWLSRQLAIYAGSESVAIFRGLIYCLPLAIVFFLLRENLSVILSAAFGAMLVANFVVAETPADTLTIVEREVPPVAVAGDAPPPLLHLVIDQQIGIDGLPPEVEGTPQLRQTLLDFYKDYGFRLHPGAFTHFPATMESIPDLLNGALVPSSRNFISVRGGKIRLRKNAWFEELRRRGYEIEVIQSDYIDYCHGDDAPVSYCATFIASDIRDIADLNLSTAEKSSLLLYNFFDEDFEQLARVMRLAWYGFQKKMSAIGVTLPDWNHRSMTLSPIPALRAMDLVTEQAAKIGSGQAIFSHLLLPHDPYILDRDCQTKSDFGLWKHHEAALWWHRVKSDPDRRLARYVEYYSQVLCLHKKLKVLFDTLEKRGVLDEATIIIHGDHGSRISMIEPVSGNEGLMTSRDIIDNLSTLYAIRSPDLEPGIIEGQRSIQALFATNALGIEGLQENLSVYLKDPANIVGPRQTELQLVPFLEK